MLDTKSHVRRPRHDATRATDEQAQRILDNRFYRNISGALSGTQEYMAMEKLYELHDDGGFDLSSSTRRRPATRSTSSTRRAGSPASSTTASSACSWCRPAPTLRVGSVAAQAFLRTVVAGRRRRGRRRRRRVLPRVRGHGGGLPRPGRGGDAAPRRRRDRVRARHVAPARRGGGGASSSRERLADGDFVGRRARSSTACTRSYVPARRRTCCATRARELGARARRRRGAARDCATRTSPTSRRSPGRERRELSGLEERIGDASVAYVPELGHDVHDFAALREVADHLLAGADRGRDPSPTSGDGVADG